MTAQRAVAAAAAEPMHSPGGPPSGGSPPCRRGRLTVGGRYLARQFAQAVFTIVFIVLLNFVLFRMMPGSPDRVARATRT